MKTLQQVIKEKDIQELLSVDPGQSLTDALTVMAKYKIGCDSMSNIIKSIGIEPHNICHAVIVKRSILGY